MAEKYNGWSNYETWNVALWLDNDQGTHEYIRENVRASRDTWTGAGFIENYVEEITPDLGASMFSDLLSASLRQVNWYEIAEHFQAD